MKSDHNVVFYASKTQEILIAFSVQRSQTKVQEIDFY